MGNCSRCSRAPVMIVVVVIVTGPSARLDVESPSHCLLCTLDTSSALHTTDTLTYARAEVVVSSSNIQIPTQCQTCRTGHKLFLVAASDMDTTEKTSPNSRHWTQVEGCKLQHRTKSNCKS